MSLLTSSKKKGACERPVAELWVYSFALQPTIPEGPTGFDLSLNYPTTLPHAR